MQPGDVIADRYVLQSVAGAGGMGTVFCALDRAQGTQVALKALTAGGAADAARFAREAAILSRLDHPGIVRYLGHGQTAAGDPYLLMEWLVGEDLARRLARAPLGLHASATLIERAASALAHAHAAGVVHRDLKPGNLVLRGGDPEQPVLVDFGIARWREPGATVTRTGATLGTVGYMAPEQARGAREADAQADVFALGCVLFECLTGRPAFTGAHALAVLAKVLLEDPPRASEAQPELPDVLDGLLARMLAKDPSARPPGAAAVARGCARRCSTFLRARARARARARRDAHRARPSGTTSSAWSA
jgi:serine/threonine protein kinase